MKGLSPMAIKEEIDKHNILDTHLVRVLNEARSLNGSREVSLVITKIEEAIFWNIDSKRKKESDHI